MKRDSLIVGLLLSLSFSLLLIEIVENFRLAVQGEVYGELQDKITLLRRENENIRNEILHDEALQTISDEASEAGFIPATYLVLPK